MSAWARAAGLFGIALATACSAPDRWEQYKLPPHLSRATAVSTGDPFDAIWRARGRHAEECLQRLREGQPPEACSVVAWTETVSFARGCSLHRIAAHEAPFVAAESDMPLMETHEALIRAATHTDATQGEAEVFRQCACRLEEMLERTPRYIAKMNLLEALERRANIVAAGPPERRPRGCALASGDVPTIARDAVRHHVDGLATIAPEHLPAEQLDAMEVGLRWDLQGSERIEWYLDDEARLADADLGGPGIHTAVQPGGWSALAFVLRRARRAQAALDFSERAEPPAVVGGSASTGS